MSMEIWAMWGKVSAMAMFVGALAVCAGFFIAAGDDHGGDDDEYL